jgi:hypothetical protein
MEPDFARIPRKSFRALQVDNSLYTIYQQKLDSSGLDYSLAGVHYGKINEAPAPRAAVFQVVTWWLSHLLWLLPLAVFFITFFGDRKKARKTATPSPVFNLRVHKYRMKEKV